MTRIVLVAAAILAMAAMSFANQTQKLQTLTGTVTDSMCAQSHESNIEHARENSGRTMTAKECTVGCVTRRGQKYVLAADGKIYQIANQDYAGLPVYAAETVKLTGSLTGDTIRVSQIVSAGKSTSK